MKIDSFRRMILLAILIRGAAWESQAAVIFDTGPAGNHTPGFPLFTLPDDGGFRWLAGQFTLHQNILLTGVEGWIGNIPNAPGAIDLSVTEDAGGIPGAVLFTQSFALPGDSFVGARWLGISDDHFHLKAGTYWITFAPQAGTVGTSMPFGAPHPLDNYAIWDYQSADAWQTGSSGFGMRVSGNFAIAPEPSFYGVAASGILGALVLRRRRFRVLEGKNHPSGKYSDRISRVDTL